MKRAGLLLGALVLAGSGAAAPADPQQAAYEKDVRPLLAKYCFGCHGGAKPKAELNLESFRDEASALKSRRTWKKVYDILHADEMPPADKPQPTPAERERITDWVESLLSRPVAGGKKDPGPVVLRRLTGVEYNNTVSDLFGLFRPPRIPFDPAQGAMPASMSYRHGSYRANQGVELPPDDVAHGYTTIGEALSMPPFLMERYLRTAAEIVRKCDAQITGMWRQAPGASDRDKARSLLSSFGTRAFRRPISPQEVERHLGIFDLAVKAGDPPESAARVAIQSVLVSPDFLYKVEKDGPADDPRGVRPLNDYELASRLSYFLWSSMPDGALFQLAQQGKLRDPAVLETEARRMLKNPKSGEFASEFGTQWLQVDGVAAHMPNPSLFPAFYEGDAALAMLVEAVLFFETILSEDRSVLDFVDADFMWLNPQLSKIYGIVPEGRTNKGDWRRIKLSDPRRGGILTLAAVLTVTSYGSRTSPVKRGKWLLETVLGAPPPPPLPDAGAIADEAATADGLSVRKKLEAHRTNPRCASCHKRIDPLGFALENYNAIGQWRDKDGAAPVDAAGTLPDGTAFNGPVELKKAILTRHKDAFVRSLAEHMMTYALGRKVDYMDAPAIQEIVRAVEKDGYKFSRLVVEIVKSYPFGHRRNREVKDE
jgi:mono/diheme cytochrome c family protein